MTSAFHVYFGPEALATAPKVRLIGPSDCFSALREGFDDFLAMPTYPAFVGLFYAVAGIALVAMSSFASALHLIFPLAAGFALIGPFVAIGLYEMSRRRERGLAVRGRDAFRRPSLARAALDPGVRPDPARDLRGLDLRRRAYLRLALRTQSSGRRASVPHRCVDHRARLAAHHCRRARRLLLRCARALHQRRFVPV